MIDNNETITGEELLHEPALSTMSRGVASGLVRAIVQLGRAANESNAATADMKFGWLKEGETVDAVYVPEVILRVTKAV